MICQCPAIVLRAIDFQESSRIASLYAREYGKVSVIAKGARTQKSKFSGKLEPGLIVDAIYHHKSGRSVHTLTEVSVPQPWPPTANQPDRYASRIAFTDLLNRLLQEDGANEALFDNCAQVLKWLVETPHNPVHLFPYIVVRLCDWLGVAIRCDMRPLDEESKPLFELETGLVSIYADAGGMPLTHSMFAYLFHAVNGQRNELLEMELPKSDLRQMTYLMDRYIAYHFDGVRPRTTQILFDTYSEILS